MPVGRPSSTSGIFELLDASISVDIWTVALRPQPSFLTVLENVLCEAERERASRFHFAKDRQAHIAAHGALRHILASYLHCPPAGIQFSEGTNGKPSVLGVRFNLSHSADLALIAVTQEHEVGVDVEHIDPRRADLNVAQRFFSPAENYILMSLTIEQQTEAFFNCWTRKEAYLKAIGLGLSVPLDSFDVSLAPGEPARLLRGADARWRLRSLAPAPSYIGALAIDADTETIDITLKSFETELPIRA